MWNKHKRWFRSSRVKFLLVKMSASCFLVSVYFIWVLGSILILSNNQSRATLWVLETCLIVGLLPFMIILITALLSSKMYNIASWQEEFAFEETKSTLFRSSNFPGIDFRVRFPRTSLLWFVFPCWTVTIRSHKSSAGIPSILKPASKDMISDSVELCETEVCFLHIQLIGTNVWLPKIHNLPGSPRSIMTDWRRQTGWQTFFFRVIGSSSARIKERLADGDVIVVEVIRVPLLARGLLGVFDISLCDEVVVGLITCRRLVLGQGTKVLSGSAQGICPPHRGSWRCLAAGTAGRSERRWGRRRSEWRSRRVQEQHSQRDDTCACNVGWMRTWALSLCSVRSCEQGKTVKGRWHWQQGRETAKTNKVSCGSIHSVHESLVDVLVSFYMLQVITHVVGPVALYFVSPTQWLSMHQTYSLSDL